MNRPLRLLRLLPHRTLPLLAAALPALLPAASFAQDVPYTLQAGENLYGLAKRFLYKPEQWKQIQRTNKVRDPLRLLPGTQLMIPANLLRPQPATVEVLHVVGSARVATPGQPLEQALAVGQQLPQGSQLTVGEQGFVILRLADGSTIRLPSDTRIQFNEMLFAPASKDIQSSIRLDRGRVESKVVPLPSSNSRFEIHTPRAVGGVRGTNFGVAIADNGAFINDVREGAVLVRAQPSSAPQMQALVHAGEGTRIDASDHKITLSRLLPAPDLSAVPPVLEDVSFIELPLPALGQASAYQTMISADAGMNQVDQVVRYGTFPQALARFAGLDDGEYQLAVRAVDERGIVGTEAVRTIRVKARPEAPFLRQPQHGSQLFSPDVDMLCTQSLGTQSYHLQVARTPAFQELATDMPDLAECRLTVHGLAPGDYFWRVASVKRTPEGGRDQGPFSKPARFSILPLPPTPPAPSVKADGASMLSVQWGATTDNGAHYRLQLARDPAFENLLDDSVLQASRYARPLPAAGVYYVRLQQLDHEGRGGAFTAAQSITVPARLMSSSDQPVISSDGGPLRPGNR